MIDANLSQDANGNISAASGQIVAIAKINGGYVFGDCVAGQANAMAQDSFHGTINAQGQLSGTFFEGSNQGAVSGTYASANLTGTSSPAAGNSCVGATTVPFTGTTAFPTLNLAHPYSGQLVFFDGSTGNVQATFQESNGALTTNVVSSADNKTIPLKGYTVASAIYLEGKSGNNSVQYWGLVDASGMIVVYDEINGIVAGTLQ